MSEEALKKITAVLPTDLVDYTSDERRWESILRAAENRVCRKDGIRGLDVSLREVTVTYDPDICKSEGALKKHVRSALADLAKEPQGFWSIIFFPHFKGKLLRVTWK